MQVRLCSMSAVLLVVSFAFQGCGGTDGPDLGTVTGKVTLDGQPAAKATVIFTPESGGAPSYGGTNDEGQFTMLFTADKKGAAVGKHKVSIQSGTIKENENGKPIPGQNVTKIPNKFQKNDALSAEVKAGPNVIDFTLESK